MYKKFIFLLVLMSASAHSQMSPQELNIRNTIDAVRMQEQVDQARAQAAYRFAAAEQARLLHWQAKEEKRLKSKLFFGALATDMTGEEGNISWAGGHSDEAEARVLALKECGSSSCAVVASFANTCAMFAQPEGNKKVDNIFVATDRNSNVAIKKVLAACDAKFGKDACYFTPREEPARNKAYCTGFDYGVYVEKPWYQFW